MRQPLCKMKYNPQTLKINQSDFLHTWSIPPLLHWSIIIIFVLFSGHKSDIHCSPYFSEFSAPACVFLAPGAARLPEGKRSWLCGPDLCEGAGWARAESINQAQLKRATMALLLLLLAGRGRERGPRGAQRAMQMREWTGSRFWSRCARS